MRVLYCKAPCEWRTKGPYHHALSKFYHSFASSSFTSRHLFSRATSLSWDAPLTFFLVCIEVCSTTISSVTLIPQHSPPPSTHSTSYDTLIRSPPALSYPGRQGSVFNVLFKIKVSSLRGTIPPTNQSIWFGPQGTVGTLAAVIDGTWTLGNNQPSASTCLRANSGCTTVFTSWIVGADSSNAGYQFVQAIVASPKAYFLQVFSDKFPDGALRCQYKKPLFLGFILSWFAKG